MTTTARTSWATQPAASFATTYVCWLRRKLNDWLILSDVQYLKYATALPSSALSVRDCQAAFPLDSNQAEMKNEPFAVHWPHPSQCRWIVLFIICSGKDSPFSMISPQKHSVTSETQQISPVSIPVRWSPFDFFPSVSVSLSFTFKTFWQKQRRQKVSFPVLLSFCYNVFLFLSLKNTFL